ncbi:Chromatin assembly factor 1 subunit [Dirofilaria immitis]
MDMNGDDVNKYSAQRHEKVQQYTDEVVASEVNDFVREVIEAVTYIIDHRKTSCRHGKHAVGEHVMTFELNDRDSVIGNPRKKETWSVPHGNMPVHRCRKIAVTEQEKKMEEGRKIAIEKNKRDVVIEERRRQKEEAQKKKERLKREQEEARVKRRKEEQQRKELRKKEEKEKKEQRRIEEEVRRQKKQKEEEDRKKKRKEEEEKREKKRREEEVMQLKKRRESDHFLSFFNKKEKTERGTEAVQISSVLNVLPFFCKQGVSLAPIFRRKPLSKEVHDSLLMDVQSVERPYLSTVKPRDVGKVKLNRAKLFQFHDNWRPPYYGTWRKRSTVITGRKPFVKDTKVLDYEIDSDEEWEIPEGDDCDQSTMSDEDEEDSDHSIDNDGFIVQHGYLSEGEGEDEEDRLEHHEDSSKRAERLKAMANEWEHNLEKKSEKFNTPLIPLLWGPHFELPEEVIIVVMISISKIKAWTDYYKDVFAFAAARM